MATRHVFIETNWVVDCCAPQPFRVPEATDLLKRAGAGEIKLHLPIVCLNEARNIIRKKFQPRNQLNPLRNYLRWGRANGKIDSETESFAKRIFDQYEAHISSELDTLEATLKTFSTMQGLSVFALSEAMLERTLSLAFERLDLHPFDNAILAAVLIRAAELKKQEPDAELFFCELDSDLRPWDKQGNLKPALKQLYDEARVWVYGDFAMTSHERPDNWKR